MQLVDRLPESFIYVRDIKKNMNVNIQPDA